MSPDTQGTALVGVSQLYEKWSLRGWDRKIIKLPPASHIYPGLQPSPGAKCPHQGKLKSRECS